MDSLPAPKRQLTAKQKRLLRAGAILGGVALGYICPLLPVEKQFVCHFAARILALLTGAS